MSTSTRNADIVTLYFQFIVRWFSILVPRRRARWLWLRVSFWLTSRKVILSYRKVSLYSHRALRQCGSYVDASTASLSTFWIISHGKVDILSKLGFNSRGLSRGGVLYVIRRRISGTMKTKWARGGQGFGRWQRAAAGWGTRAGPGHRPGAIWFLYVSR